MTDLTIIVVTWNNEGCIRDCLAALASAAGGYSTRLICVDNDSGDDTVPIIEREFPQAELVKNRENVGFAAANNQALRLSRPRYWLLLNPDAIVQPGAVDALIGFLDRHPEVWAAGPAMLNADGTQQRTGVTFPNNWNLLCEALFLDRAFPLSKLFGGHRQLYENAATSRSVDYLQGAALMIRFEAVQRVGGLDERFFMYFEETDWCYRIGEAGGKVQYVPEAKVVHLGGGEFGHFDERRLVAYHRSLIAFYEKHYTALRRAGLWCVLLLRSMVRAAVWAVVGLVRPSESEKAHSSLRGYVKTIAILFQGGR